MTNKFVRSPKAKLVARALSVLLIGIILVLSVLTYMNSALGWFSRNEDVRGSGVGINTSHATLDVDFEYFMYDVKSEEYLSESDLSEMDFNQYDLVFRSRNRLTPIVVRFAVDKSQLPNSGTLTAVISRDTTKPATVTEGGNLKMSAFSSSVMRFTPFLGSAYYNADAETQFKNVDTNVNFNATRALTGDDATSGSQVFTAVDYTGSTVNSVTKDSEITLSYGFTQSDFVNDKLYAYVYITYDEGYGAGNYNGLTGIYSKTAGLSDIGAESVTFANDLLSIKVALAA